jgi:hypothetical protein
VVLGGPHERPDFCGDDAANTWTRVSQPVGYQALVKPKM